VRSGGIGCVSDTSLGEVARDDSDEVGACDLRARLAATVWTLDARLIFACYYSIYLPSLWPE
jgi:hypothetical protein